MITGPSEICIRLIKTGNAGKFINEFNYGAAAAAEFPSVVAATTSDQFININYGKNTHTQLCKQLNSNRTLCKRAEARFSCTGAAANGSSYGFDAILFCFCFFFSLFGDRNKTTLFAIGNAEGAACK